MISKERLEKEIENLAFTILKEKIVPFAESFVKEYPEALKTTGSVREKEIMMEYEKQLTEMLLSSGYTACVLDGKNFNYISDRKLATEVLEKLSPAIQAFKDAPRWSTLIEFVESSSQRKSRESV